MIIMKTLRGTLKRSILGANSRKKAAQGARSLFAAFLACLIAGGPLSPAFAQSPAQDPAPSGTPAAAPAAQGSPIAPVASLGLGAHDYSHGPRVFPNIIKPYESIPVERPVLTNSPRIDQLIHDNKLELSLQDAVELALENSLDIAVQRYYPWISDASILKTKSGAPGYSTPGSSLSSSTASLPILSYDPTLTASV